jgi:hypothetical protein
VGENLEVLSLGVLGETSVIAYFWVSRNLFSITFRLTWTPFNPWATYDRKHVKNPLFRVQTGFDTGNGF